MPGKRHEDAADAFRIHDERAHVILRGRVGLEVGHIVADPSLLRFVPPDLAARSASHGLPSRSQEARLYSTRRFMGQDHAQFG